MKENNRSVLLGHIRRRSEKCPSVSHSRHRAPRRPAGTACCRTKKVLTGREAMRHAAPRNPARKCAFSKDELQLRCVKFAEERVVAP